ncbi:Single-stranded DNA-binding protein [Nonomuraea maritima]|uniref:Single-stranded DNA-binding protein n=1 Tax=Nonomuraea maritima TaxID=683260 RepID=A0A1G9C7N9_9ACTN|nr:single-stranded DNA-binding protein [Nonomuraea maritima]SDK47680.1 Single-stranded DNA-binding protein [Nonomuraea maritima]
MDKNEVTLVGRLSASVEEHPLPSGDTVTKWRVIVRRRRHRRGAALTDSVPCVTFDPDIAAVVRGLQPRDYLEVAGALRCRVFGPSAAKIWRYEVEVSAARPYEAEPAEPDAPTDQPEGGDLTAALVPRQVASLAAIG